MENNTENALALAHVKELQTTLFGSSDIKRVTNLDLNNEAEADMLLNSMQECDYKLNDFVDKELTIVAFYVTEKITEGYNETGEVTKHSKHSLILFDNDGKSYVTGSNSCYLSFLNIISIKGTPTKEKPIILKPIKTNAKEQGHFYLKLKIVNK